MASLSPEELAELQSNGALVAAAPVKRPVTSLAPHEVDELQKSGGLTDEKTFEEKHPKLAKALKYAGETGAGFVSGAAKVGEMFDPVVAAGAAAGSYAVPYTAPEGATFGERWRNEMEGLRNTRKELQRKAPVAETVGTFAPVVLAPAAMGGLPSASGALSSAAGPGAKALAGVTDAALYNYLSAAGSNADKDPIAAGNAAAMSPTNLLGAVPTALQYGVPNGKQMLSGALSKVAPRPTPEAEYLMSKGVDLTTGQMLPKDSRLRQIEDAAAGTAHGHAVAQMKEVPQGQWNEAMLKEGLPNGMDGLPEGSLTEKLQGAYEGFKAPYAEIKGQQVYPAIHQNGKGTPLQGTPRRPGAFDSAVVDPNIHATPNDRTSAANFLKNQLGLLKGGSTRPGMVEKTDAGNLLEMRSNIREQAKKYAADSPGYAEIMDKAQEAVTDALNSQLRPELADLLAKTDAQYGKYKLVETAQARAGLHGEYTPKQLGSVLRQSIGNSQFARGGGGEMREMANAAEQAFAPSNPPNGLRGAAMHVGGQHWNAPAAMIFNSPVVKNAIRGTPYNPAIGPAPFDSKQAALLARKLFPDDSEQDQQRKMVELLRSQEK